MCTKICGWQWRNVSQLADLHSTPTSESCHILRDAILSVISFSYFYAKIVELQYPTTGLNTLTPRVNVWLCQNVDKIYFGWYFRDNRFGHVNGVHLKYGNALMLSRVSENSHVHTPMGFFFGIWQDQTLTRGLMENGPWYCTEVSTTWDAKNFDPWKFKRKWSFSKIHVLKGYH